MSETVNEKKLRAGRNKTLTIMPNEIDHLAANIISAKAIPSDGYIDKIINADLFDAIDFLPDGCFDLIIIDPPYNLDKNFNGTHFAAMNPEDYESYLRSWFYKVWRLEMYSRYAESDFRTSDRHQPHLVATRKRAWRKDELEKRYGGYMVCRQKS
jgi:hypothetical protein